MAYTAWSVVFGEQPTAAKWNQLGANDAGFKDATNIDNGAITLSKLNAASLLSGQQAWQAPTLLNSWVNFGGGFQAAGYMKDSLGFVHLKGLLKNGTPGANPMFTLPVGYRPLGDMAYAVNSNSAFGILQVLANGNVIPLQGSTAFFYIDGIIFKAEA